MSEKSREYILNLDIDADVRLLQESLQIGTEALDFFRASTKILQAGVKAGLSLYDIAVMCCRYDDAGKSRIAEFKTNISQLKIQF